MLAVPFALAILASAPPALAAAIAGGAGGAPAAPDAPHTFFIQAIDVAGVTRLTPAEIEQLVYPHLGPGRDQKDVEAARKAVQDAYAARGFGAVLVDVPAQDPALFAQGIVQLAVSEAPIGLVRVIGSRFHALSVARAQVPALVEGQPLDIKALQAQVSAANRFPDRTLDPQFKPGKVAGELDVDLQVNDQRPAHASVELDNDQSPATSPLRLTASMRYTNLWQRGQTASFTYVVAPENRDDTEVFAGAYSIPFLGTPWSLSISGYDSNSNVASLGGSSVLGRGFQAGFRLLYRLPAGKVSQSISFGADFKDFKQNIFAGGVQASAAPIMYVPFEVQYAIAGASEHTSWEMSLGTTVGLRAIKQLVCISSGGTTCTTADAFQNREQFSNENFVRGNLTADFSYAFGNDTVASFKLAAQLADSHLITNEQFAAGGLSSVRGYYASEAVGDNGVSPSLELRSPSVATLFGHWLNEARLYGFADSAFIHVDSASAGQRRDFRLIGVGGGLRVQLISRLSGDVLVGVPLTSGPSTTRFHPRVNFQIKGDF